MIRRSVKLAVIGLLTIRVASAETYLVTNTADDGDGSLHWALSLADNGGLPDTVHFAIPMDDPGYDPVRGVWTIATDSLNPDPDYSIRYGNVCVDGSSQAEFVGSDTNPYGPEVELAGPYPNTPGGGGFIIKTDNVVIRGFCINRFHWEAVSISGWPPGEIAEEIAIEGCYLNVDPTGTYRIDGGRKGIIASHVKGLRIGGDAPEQRNIISGGFFVEVFVNDGDDVEVVNNIIGGDRTGTVDLGQGFNQALGHDTMRGVHEIRDNLIVGRERSYLVRISHTGSDSARFELVGNRIGVGLDGSDLGPINDAVMINYHPWGLIADNIIAHAGGPGIWLNGDTTDYVTISRNSIYACGGKGISLANDDIANFHGVDFVDGVYGPGVNEEIDTPLCESISAYGDSTTSAHGDSTVAHFRCMPDCVVEVFIADPSLRAVCSESGYDYVYSGMTYLGDAEETVPGPVWSTYRFSVSPALPVGTLVTCTATNQNGSTSEFGCTCRVGQVGTTERGCVPSEYVLSEPGPNPFSNSTVVTYQLPEAGPVNLSVFDLAGSMITTLANGAHGPGVYGVRWDGEDSEGVPVPSGTYVVRLVSSGLVESKRVVVMR